MGTFKNSRIYFSILFFLPWLLGWQKISLTECPDLKKQPVSEAAQGYNSIQPPPGFVLSAISPNRIFEKSINAFYKLKFLKAEIETWLQTPAYHTKINFNSEIENIDNEKTSGRVSMSSLSPGSFSTSEWVKTYNIGGMPFTWDLNKKGWRKEELKIPNGNSKEGFKYGILRSLFVINEDTVALSTIKLINIEKKNGKDCFVLQYKLEPEAFGFLGVVGDVTVRNWIDSESFLPQSLRAEGKITELYFLQSVNYSDFNAGIGLAAPSEIIKEVNAEKESLKGKMKVLTQEAAGIRGWPVPEKINLEFKDRVSLRDYIEENIDFRYAPQQLDNEGLIMKWLGLLEEGLDYKESMINSEVISSAGLYDKKASTVLLGDWLNPALTEAVFVREIAHMMQDKFTDIGKFKGGSNNPGDLDLRYARQSLVEGEAIAVMLECLLKKEGGSFINSTDIFEIIEKKLLRVNQYAKKGILYNIYGYGTSFIQDYLKQASWQDLAGLYNNPPSSMREIMQPYLYLNKKERDNEIKKESPLADSFLGEWLKTGSFNLGQFLILLSLRQSLDKEVAEKASIGWQYDEAGIYENKNKKKLILFVSKWDTAMDASEFLKAYKDRLNKTNPLKIEEDKGAVFFQAEGKGLFFCKAKDNWVKIVWAKDIDADGFKLLAEKICAGIK